MELIGAGLPRTATLSQKVALETLGFSPCYHMVDVLNNLDLVVPWIDAFEGSVDWEQMFAGYRSTVDWPGAFFYKELAETFPHAKVLLSVRDSEAWARSMYDTVWGVFYGSSLMQHLSAARGQVDPAWSRYIEFMTAMWQKSGLLASEDGSSEPVPIAGAMERYTEEVKNSVPPERLLVWSPADGWDPLCEFLDVPVPHSPFPRVNDSVTFVDRIIDLSLASLTDWQAQQARFASR